MFLHYINTKQKHIKVFFLPNANKYPHQISSTSTPLAHSSHPLRCSFSTSLHPLIYSIRQRRENAHETVSISASPQQFLSSSSSFYIMLHMCILWCFQASLHVKRKLTLRNMNGSLYCCYQNSPYQLCPHILVFMFKNYTHTHKHTHTHTHNMYIITRMFQSF